jgi:arylsulfatase A-like enzyme
LKRHGYQTACVGKWHLGLEWQKKDGGAQKLEFYHKDVIAGENIDYAKPILYGPNQYGFDYFYGLPASLDQPPFVYIENDHVLEEPDHISGVKNLDRRGATMQTQWERGPIAPSYDHTKVLDDMNDKVLELIENYSKKKEEPFFIYYPTPAVHGPLLPNERFQGKSGLNLYADVVLQVDDMVRQIDDKLHQTGMAENTIFIFTSDNGCSGVADYPALAKLGHDPSGGYRGKKFDVYEGGHRVPTIVRYPDGIRGGQESDALVCHSDFFATFAELLGEKIPDEAAEDSISNLPVWKNPKQEVREDAVFAAGTGFLAIEKDGWKLECCEDGGSSEKAFEAAQTGKEIPQEFELYHISEDKGEKSNIYEKHPEIVSDLKDRLTKRYKDGRTSEGAVQKNFEPEGSWVQINWMG